MVPATREPGDLPDPRADMTSKSHSSSDKSAPRPETGQRVWQIRTDSGDTFGPADLPTLKTWALDGRLAPNHQLSADGKNWTHVSAMPELEMDWVAEITPGTFYGPIHKQAMAELIREGAINEAAPRFQRGSSTPAAPSGHEQLMEQRIQELQLQLASQSATLEAQRLTARDELENVKSQLDARNLEFDAERQEQKAALARQQAELLKRDSRINALETSVQRIEQLARERQILENRLADAERSSTEHNRLLTQLQTDLDQTRNQQRDAERLATQAQEMASRHDAEAASMREHIRTLKSRLDSTRKLLQQAAATIGTDDITDAEIVGTPPPADAAASFRNGAPPLASPSGRTKPGLSMADLEAQARHELRQLSHKGGSLFRSRTHT